LAELGHLAGAHSQNVRLWNGRSWRKAAAEIGALAEAPLATYHEISEHLQNFGVNVAFWQLNFMESINVFNSRFV
jgi:hypothetical protein